jgi:hypothetical protein
MMDRRAFLGTLAGGLLASPGTAVAQPGRSGFLIPPRPQLAPLATVTERSAWVGRAYWPIGVML